MPEERRVESGRVVSRHALKDQEGLWLDLLKLAAAVEEMFTLAVLALTEGRPELAAQVKERERAIDGWEVRIERECLRILALYEPVASDLRRLGTVLRVNGDLERISNLSRNVAKRVAKRAADPGASPIPPSLETLALEARAQVCDSLDALTRPDVAKARAVIAGDDRLDRRYHEVLDALKDAIRRDPDQLDRFLRLINTARNLERIADHAVNIARDAVYMVEGDIIRHAPGNPRGL